MVETVHITAAWGTKQFTHQNQNDTSLELTHTSWLHVNSQINSLIYF